VREVATGVWHWRAAHPEWKPGQNRDRMVSSQRGLPIYVPPPDPPDPDPVRGEVFRSTGATG